MCGPYLNPQQFNVYRLIWQRFVASQMAQAVFDVTQVDILGTPTQGDTAYTFRASGSVIRFPGFLEVYREGRDAGDADDEIDKDALPALNANEPVDLVSLLPEQHWTQPPPRYTEASLVKALEERGIGRPSTYALDDRDDPQSQLRDEGRESPRAERVGHHRHGCAGGELRGHRRLRLHLADGGAAG